MEENMRGNSKIISKMVMANMNGAMEDYMKVIIK